MTVSRPQRRWALIVVIIAVFWCGMLMGVSFLATPVKFWAPSLSLAVALDIGRHTFAAFSRIEWGLSLLLLAALVAGLRMQPMGVIAAAGVGVVVLVGIQTIWLLPVLDLRVGLIMAGQAPPPSRLHVLYIVLETVKLLGLLVIAVMASRPLTKVLDHEKH